MFGFGGRGESQQATEGMAQPSLLRTAVPERSARRLLCPALFTYTRLTSWPHSYRQLTRDRRVMLRGVSKVNQMLCTIGSIEYQKSFTVQSKTGFKIHVYETPREAPGLAETAYTLGDVWRLRLLLVKQLNAIIRAAADSGRAAATAEGDISRGPSLSRSEEEEASSGLAAVDLGGSSPAASSPALLPGCPLSSTADRYILYLHGGAFISQSPEFYRIFLNEISRETGTRVIAPCYPLAPESLFPSQLHEIFRVYRQLVEDEGIDPNNIVLVGDSAGGNLAVTLLMQIVKHNQEKKEKPLGLPKGAVLLSPWLDLSQSGPSYTLNKAAEPLLPLQSIRRSASLYVFGHRAFAEDMEMPVEDASLFRSPWVSPVYLSDPEVLRAFPPICIHTGSVEVIQFVFTFPSALWISAEAAAAAHAEAAAAEPAGGGSREVCAEAAEAALAAAAAAAEAADLKAAAAEAATAEAAATEAAVAEFQDPPAAASAVLGAAASAEALAFISAERAFSEEEVSSGGPLGGAHNEAPPLPSFFKTAGWLSDKGLKLLENEWAIDAAETDDPKRKQKASVFVWKDEFHVFPCFGFMEEPSASDCTRRICKWINELLGDPGEQPAAAAAAAGETSRTAAAAETEAKTGVAAETGSKAAETAAAAENKPAATTDTPTAA
ncbi:hypothetical protein Efla_001210 [Eimeria flavescens]